MPRAPLLIALFAAIACQDPVSPAPVVATGSPAMARSAAAPLMFNERTPFSFIIGCCTGEAVSVSGEAHSVTQIWYTAEGYRALGHQNMNLVGVGLLTGLPYRFLQTSMSDYEFTWSTGNSAQNVVVNMKVIAQGAASDWRVTVHGTYVYEQGVFRFIPRRSESVCS
jgi:hypothetical protein